VNEERKNEAVRGSGQRGARKRAVSRASPCVQPLHAAVQNDTTMGLASEKLPIQAFLHGLSQGCFDNRLEHNTNVSQQPNGPNFTGPMRAKGSRTPKGARSVRSVAAAPVPNLDHPTAPLVRCRFPVRKTTIDLAAD
jgi:hypothetical protein